MEAMLVAERRNLWFRDLIRGNRSCWVMRASCRKQPHQLSLKPQNTRDHTKNHSKTPIKHTPKHLQKPSKHQKNHPKNAPLLVFPIRPPGLRCRVPPWWPRPWLRSVAWACYRCLEGNRQRSTMVSNKKRFFFGSFFFRLLFESCLVASFWAFPKEFTVGLLKGEKSVLLWPLLSFVSRPVACALSVSSSVAFLSFLYIGLPAG